MNKYKTYKIIVLLSVLVKITFGNSWEVKNSFYNIQVEIPSDFKKTVDESGDIPVFTYKLNKNEIILNVITGISPDSIIDSNFKKDYIQFFQMANDSKVVTQIVNGLIVYVFNDSFVDGSSKYSTIKFGTYSKNNTLYGSFIFRQPGNKKIITISNTIINSLTPVTIGSNVDGYVKIHPLVTDYTLYKLVDFGTRRIILSRNYKITNKGLKCISRKVERIIISDMPQINEGTLSYLKKCGVNIVKK